MQAATVGALIEAVARLWQLAPTAEITLEANPGSVERARFSEYRAAGVNRASVGVQALNEADLKALGRIHTVDEARSAVATAVDIFERVSFDLIYARSGQTPAHWRRELAEALSYSPSHLSLYQLTIEPGTAFEKLHRAGALSLPEDESAAEMFDLTQELTEAAGLPAYEVSNHARSGEESRHNLIYWRYGEYVGAGPGAHGRVRLGHADGDPVATQTERHPETWVDRTQRAGNGIVEQDAISRAMAADEMLIMGLRLAEGVDLERLSCLTGLVPHASVVDDLLAEGLVERPGGGHRLRAVGRGRFLVNSLVFKLSEALVVA